MTSPRILSYSNSSAEFFSDGTITYALLHTKMLREMPIICSGGNCGLHKVLTHSTPLQASQWSLARKESWKAVVFTTQRGLSMRIALHWRCSAGSRHHASLLQLPFEEETSALDTLVRVLLRILTRHQGVQTPNFSPERKTASLWMSIRTSQDPLPTTRA